MQRDIDNENQGEAVPCSTDAHAIHNQQEELSRGAAQAVLDEGPSCEPATGSVHPKVPRKKGRMTMAREDLYQKVTDTIVAELERGVVNLSPLLVQQL